MMNSNVQKLVELSSALQELRENQDSTKVTAFLKSFHDAGLNLAEKKAITEQAVDLGNVEIVNSLLDLGAPYTEKIRAFTRQRRINEAGPINRGTSFPRSEPAYPIYHDPADDEPMTLQQRKARDERKLAANVVKRHEAEKKLAAYGLGGAEDAGPKTPEEERADDDKKKEHPSSITAGEVGRWHRHKQGMGDSERTGAGEKRKKPHKQKPGWNKILDPTIFDREGYQATPNEIESFNLLVRILKNKLTANDMVAAGISRQQPGEEQKHEVHAVNRAKRVELFKQTLQSLSGQEKPAEFKRKDKEKTVYPEFVPGRTSELRRVLMLHDAEIVARVLTDADDVGFLSALLKYFSADATVPIEQSELFPLNSAGHALISAVMLRDDDNYDLVYDMVKELLDKGADPNSDDGFPLKMAIERDHDDIATLLMDQGASVTLNRDVLVDFLKCNNRKVLNAGIKNIADDDIVGEENICYAVSLKEGNDYVVPTYILEKLFKSPDFHWTKKVNRKPSAKRDRTKSILFVAIDREDPELFDMILYPGGIKDFWAKSSIEEALSYAQSNKIKPIQSILEKAIQEEHFFTSSRDIAHDVEDSDASRNAFKENTPIDDTYLTRLILQDPTVPEATILKMISARRLKLDPNPGQPGKERIKSSVVSKHAEALPVKSALYAAILRGNVKIVEALLEPNGVDRFWPEATLQSAILYRVSLLDEDEDEDELNDPIAQLLQAKYDLDQEATNRESDEKNKRADARKHLPDEVRKDLEKEEELERLQKAAKREAPSDSTEQTFRAKYFTPRSRHHDVPSKNKRPDLTVLKSMVDELKKAITTKTTEAVKQKWEKILVNFEYLLEDLREDQIDLRFLIDKTLNDIRVAGFNPPTLNRGVVDNAVEMRARIKNVLADEKIKKAAKAAATKADTLRFIAELEDADQQLAKLIENGQRKVNIIKQSREIIFDDLQQAIAYAKSLLTGESSSSQGFSQEDEQKWIQLSSRARELKDQLAHLKQVADEYYRKTMRRVKDPAHLQKVQDFEQELEDVNDQLTKLHQFKKDVRAKDQGVSNLAVIIRNLEGYLAKFGEYLPREIQ